MIKDSWDSFITHLIMSANVGQYVVYDIDYRAKTCYMRGIAELGKALGKEIKIRKTEGFYKAWFEVGLWCFYDYITEEEKENYGL